MSNTLETIAMRLQRMRQGKEAIEESLRDLSEERSRSKPSEDSWSVRQVVGHLLASEIGTLGYMVKKTSSGWDSLDNTEDEHRANASALVNRLAGEERYKAPAVLPEPDNEMALADLLVKWASVREQLETFARGVDPANYDKLVFRQPFAGMLNLPQTLDFINEHVNHHLPQIRRILSSQE
jgi:hypothetical protein